MSLYLYSGDKLLSETKQGAIEHREKDFTLNYVHGRGLMVKNRGGTSFLSVNLVTGECIMDVLNVPHIDVSKRAEEEKKKAAAKK